MPPPSKPSSHPTPASPPTPAGNFEESLAHLESIIERIESGEIGLEQSIAEYERGVGLLQRCREILEKAEQRVEELNRAATPERGEGEGRT